MKRFYLDACISQLVALIVRRLDPTIDITSAQALRHFRVPDDEELAHATAQGRCLVTRNHRDFVPLTREYVREGREHAGVLLLPSSLPNSDFSGIARAIVRFAREHPGAADPNLVAWLERDAD